MLTPDTLEVEEAFNAYLKARNLGNIDLENVLVSCTAQGPDGQAYFTKTYGTADGTITSGPWKGGKWSFNANTNTLTANGVELKVQRECDWESNPRRATIVYAGINDQKSYWGKKK